MATVINPYSQSIELVERFAQCLLNDCKNESDKMLVKQLASYIKYFSNEIELNRKRDEIFGKYVTMVESATEKPDCDDVLEQFQEEIEEANKQLSSHGKNKTLDNFMKMIREANLEGSNNGDSEDEIRTVSQSVNTIDPITKLPFVEPVKNKRCGHTYEKNSILGLLQQRPKVKCPIAGCDADFVRKSDLIPDNALKRIISTTKDSSQKKLKLTE